MEIERNHGLLQRIYLRIQALTVHVLARWLQVGQDSNQICELRMETSYCHQSSKLVSES